MQLTRLSFNFLSFAYFYPLHRKMRPIQKFPESTQLSGNFIL